MIEELDKKDINQIMSIWLKENKSTHYYISEEYWDNHFGDVKKEKQSMGIGSKLIEYCKSKYSELMLKVYVKNKRAVAFYERKEFKIIEEEIDEETNEKEYVMKWEK